MNEMVIYGQNINIIKQIYANTSTSIIMNKELSDLIESTIGVRQGHPLSSILFLIFHQQFRGAALRQWYRNYSGSQDNRMSTLRR
jgi:hypothetical protein